MRFVTVCMLCMLYGFEKWRNLHGDYGTSGEANLKGFWTIVS